LTRRCLEAPTYGEEREALCAEFSPLTSGEREALCAESSLFLPKSVTHPVHTPYTPVTHLRTPRYTPRTYPGYPPTKEGREAYIPGWEVREAYIPGWEAREALGSLIYRKERLERLSGPP